MNSSRSTSKILARLFVLIFVVGVIFVLEMGRDWAPLFVLGYGSLLVVAHVLYTMAQTFEMGVEGAEEVMKEKEETGGGGGKMEVPPPISAFPGEGSAVWMAAMDGTEVGEGGETQKKNE